MKGPLGGKGLDPDHSRDTGRMLTVSLCPIPALDWGSGAAISPRRVVPRLRQEDSSPATLVCPLDSIAPPPCTPWVEGGRGVRIEERGEKYNGLECP